MHLEQSVQFYNNTLNYFMNPLICKLLNVTEQPELRNLHPQAEWEL